MDVRTSARPLPRNQLVADEGQACECRLRFDRAATRTCSERDSHYEETSESHEIARWRSRARSPMSMPVAVAT